jgi:hypothetical protein
MIMRAQLKAIYSSDMDNLELVAPQDPERFCVSVRAMVGPNHGEGEESFDINVCTPKWLAGVCQSEGFVVGRHYLIVCKYDVAYIKKLIAELVEKCEGDSWQDVAERVSRIGYWEFEDYKPTARQGHPPGG